MVTRHFSRSHVPVRVFPFPSLPFPSLIIYLPIYGSGPPHPLSGAPPGRTAKRAARGGKRRAGKVRAKGGRRGRKGAVAARRRAGRHRHRAARAGRPRPRNLTGKPAAGSTPAAQAVVVLQRARLHRRAGPPARQPRQPRQPRRPHPADHPRRRPDGGPAVAVSPAQGQEPAGRRLRLLCEPSGRLEIWPILWLWFLSRWLRPRTSFRPS
jgi:hypothetical protein